MSKKKIKIAIAGATGYVGLDLIKFLSKHPMVKIKYLCAQKKIGKNIQLFNKKLPKKLPLISNLKLVNWDSVDVLFCALPNGEAQLLSKKLVNKNLHIIDLSADFRLTNTFEYKKFYGINHKAKKLINQSIYSVSEFTKKRINQYKIIACAGCYPTSIQLPLLPLIKKNLINNKNIIIDSKSGYSGAGKNLKKKFKHKNLFSSTHAYGIYKHRHVSEIDQELLKASKTKVNYTFVPHLIPTFRGMLSSIYVEPSKGVTLKRIYNELKIFYKKNYFVKILPLNRELGSENVINTNFCQISISKLKEKRRILILSAIDNLIKGAGGQAIQNMNLIYGFRENVGIK